MEAKRKNGELAPWGSKRRAAPKRRAAKKASPVANAAIALMVGAIEPMLVSKLTSDPGVKELIRSLATLGLEMDISVAVRKGRG